MVFLRVYFSVEVGGTLISAESSSWSTIAFWRILGAESSGEFTILSWRSCRCGLLRKWWKIKDRGFGKHLLSVCSKTSFISLFCICSNFNKSFFSKSWLSFSDMIWFADCRRRVTIYRSKFKSSLVFSRSVTITCSSIFTWRSSAFFYLWFDFQIAGDSPNIIFVPLPSTK